MIAKNEAPPLCRPCRRHRRGVLASSRSASWRRCRAGDRPRRRTCGTPASRRPSGRTAARAARCRARGRCPLQQCSAVEAGAPNQIFLVWEEAMWIDCPLYCNAVQAGAQDQIHLVSVRVMRLRWGHAYGVGCCGSKNVESTAGVVLRNAGIMMLPCTSWGAAS